VPILFTLAGAGIVLNLFYAAPGDALLGTAILAAGVPVFLLWRRAGRRASRRAGPSRADGSS
jgi:hypothetical protein